MQITEIRNENGDITDSAEIKMIKRGLWMEVCQQIR